MLLTYTPLADSRGDPPASRGRVRVDSAVVCLLVCSFVLDLNLFNTLNIKFHINRTN